MQDLSGQALGKYRLLARIGKGGMAVVYRAFQPGLERHVAVKALLPHLSDSDDFVRRFRREAQAVADLRHPNIVQVFDFDYDAPHDTYFMVMELVEGETLKARLARLNRAGERMPPAEVIAFFEGLLAGVGYAHRHGMVHRDLKPANIMFDRTGRTVLTDFGIARIVGGERLTETGIVMGTPVYMCPEHAAGEDGDARSDLYSLGIVLYESLTGHVPFDADTSHLIMQKHLNQPVPLLREFAPGAAALEPVVLRALAKAPEARYPSAEAMWTGLRSAGRDLGAPALALPASAESDASGAPTDSPAATRVPRFGRATAPGRSGRLARPGWAAALAGLALVVAAWLYYTPRAPGRLASDRAEAHAQLAAGDYAAALEAYDSILGRAPADTAARLGRAQALLGLGRPDAALLEVETAVEAAPESPEALVARGRYHLLYTSGPDVDAALRDFDLALELQPEFAPAHLARGWAILNFQNDPEGALPDLRRAAQLDQTDPEAQRTLAAALHQAGENASALAAIKAAIRLQAGDSELYLMSAVIRLALGEPQAAAEDLTSAIALKPKFAPYYAARAYLHVEAGSPVSALADAEKALQLDPGHAAARYARGLAYLRLSDHAQALADLDAVLEREPFEYQSPFLTRANLREINLDRALVLQAMPGRAAETLAALDRAAEAEPEWFAVYFFRGVYLAEQSQREAARADLQRAASLAPNPEWRALAETQLEALAE